MRIYYSLAHPFDYVVWYEGLVYCVPIKEGWEERSLSTLTTKGLRRLPRAKERILEEQWTTSSTKTPA